MRRATGGEEEEEKADLDSRSHGGERECQKQTRFLRWRLFLF
jgi:hypothetical protein